jgi:hypothetical protein
MAIAALARISLCALVRYGEKFHEFRATSDERGKLANALPEEASEMHAKHETSVTVM